MLFAPWQALSNANEVLRNTLATISEKPGALESPGEPWSCILRPDEAKLAQNTVRFLRDFGGIWADFVWNLELKDVEVHFPGPRVLHEQ